MSRPCVMYLSWNADCWATDGFWRAIEIAVAFAAAAEPAIREDFIRDAILKEWLALSRPAGNA